MDITLHKLVIDIPANSQDKVIGLLSIEAPGGWQEEVSENGLRAILFFENPQHLDALRKKIETAAPECACESSLSAIPDPLEAWKEFFTPVTCGDSFVILPPWLADEDFSQKHKILIEPKSAFGTGHHATTRLCLAAVDRLAKRRAISQRDEFLDLGCGSGVLGIACALLGMKGTGVDIDPVAVDNSKENRDLNKAKGLTVRASNGAEGICAAYSLVLANILAAPLIEMAETVSQSLINGGWLVLSGLLKSQANAVGTAYEKNGLTWIESSSENEWVALVLKKQIME